MNAVEKQSDNVFYRCFNPSIIKNKYDGKDYAVSCRYCLGCLSQRSLRLRNLLQNEFRYGSFKFPVFVTFTYSEDNLPMFFRTVNDDGTLSPFYISDFGQVIPAKLIDETTLPNQSFADFNKLIANHPKYVYNAFASFNVADLQKCFKRLRISIKRKLGISSDAFRYFFVSEYGSRRYRPHYHGFFWCSTQEVQKFLLQQFDTSNYSDAQRNKLGLSSLWSLGRTDASVPRCDESVNSYISSYISCLSNSYNFRVKGFRPFYICSKSPYIGSNPRELHSLENTLFYASCGLRRLTAVYDKKATDGKTVTNVLYSPSVLYTVLPRCDEFSALSRSQRVAKYSTLYGRSDYEIAWYQDFVKLPDARSWSLQRFGVIDGVSYSVNDIHCMRRCAYYCHLLHISPLRYVELLTDFYTSYASELLRKQCEAYSEVSALTKSNMYMFDADLVLTRTYLDASARGCFSAPLRAVLGSLFGDSIPLPSQVLHHLSNNPYKKLYVDEVTQKCRSHIKHRYTNEYNGITSW